MDLARGIDTIPLVASTAERAGKFPNPSVGQRVQNAGTGAIERWNGTAWVTDIPFGTSPTFTSVTTGGLTATGNTTLGDATSDTVTMTARVASDVVPSTANARSLGSAALPFAAAYLAEATVGSTRMVTQTTDTVSAATIILSATSGNFAYFAIVTGRESGSGNDEFLDLVAFASNGASAAVVASSTLEGSPAVRTYSMSTGNLRVAMASGTYHIGVYAFRIPRT